MNQPHTHNLTRRQALTRVLASLALGTAAAATIVGLGISSSSAKVDAGPTGTAAAQPAVDGDRMACVDLAERARVAARGPHQGDIGSPLHLRGD